MTRTLVLLRHGQTAWNAEGRAQGHIDVPLDDVGRAQAESVAPVMASLHPVFVRSSDLMRAAETADVVAAACGLTAVRDPALREYDVGERGGLTIAEFALTHPDAHAAWVAAGGWSDNAGTVTGSESTADVLTRMVPALRSALSAVGPGETGVIVGHGAALRATLSRVLGCEADGSAMVRGLANCGWAVLEDSPDVGLRLAAYNRIAPDFPTVGAVG